MDYFYQRNRCSPPIYCTLSLSFWLFSSRPIRRVRYTFSKSPYAGCQRNHSRSFYNIANIVDGSHCFMEMASLFSQAFYIPIYILLLSLAVSRQHSILRHAVSHYPGGQNLEQVLFAFITGFIYGALRIKKPENFTIFSLCLAHILHNISYDLITCYITM